jgi:hypothetical protein
MHTHVRVVAALHFAVVLITGASIAQAQTFGRNDTLAAVQLTADERRQILAAVEESAYDVPESWDEELRAKSVDLGSSRGIVLQGTNLLCGATGNCQLFVLRKVNDRWLSLFESEQAPLASSFTFGPAVTRGIKDLTVVTNSSAQAGERVNYSFDGLAYRQARMGPPSK